MSTLGDALHPDSVAYGQHEPDARSVIRRTGELLVASGRVSASYTDALLTSYDDYGPYFVVAPGVAIVHAAPGRLVREVAFSMLTLEPPVAFGSPNDPVHTVVGIAAPDAEAHVAALRQVAELLQVGRLLEWVRLREGGAIATAGHPGD